MARIFDGVILGDGAFVDETAIIGVPPIGVEEVPCRRLSVRAR
jgi:hypothetical protein